MTHEESLERTRRREYPECVKIFYTRVFLLLFLCAQSHDCAWVLLPNLDEVLTNDSPRGDGSSMCNDLVRYVRLSSLTLLRLPQTGNNTQLVANAIAIQGRPLMDRCG